MLDDARLVESDLFERVEPQPFDLVDEVGTSWTKLMDGSSRLSVLRSRGNYDFAALLADWRSFHFQNVRLLGDTSSSAANSFAVKPRSCQRSTRFDRSSRVARGIPMHLRLRCIHSGAQSRRRLQRGWPYAYRDCGMHFHEHFRK
jgi:hypothetical protein